MAFRLTGCLKCGRVSAVADSVRHAAYAVRHSGSRHRVSSQTAAVRRMNIYALQVLGFAVIG